MSVQFPTAAEVLFDEKPRFLILFGGRGSGKSWSAARALLIRASAKPLRILCAREFQNSIAESVHRLLSEQLKELGLEDFYTVQNQSITGLNGSEFIFAGLKNNVAKIKSYEGIDIVWCEEAQAISKTSWDILNPTIRKPGSQIICTFNPVLDTDFIYKTFITDPPDNAVVVKMNYTENPWFGEPMRTEMLQMRQKDQDSWLNIWGGHPRQTLEGAIYAREIREATEDNRITRVPYDRSKPVSTFWDLGWSDMTSIWCAQRVGFEFRIIDFVQDRHQTIGHYAKLLQSKPYIYEAHWLPHDAQSQQQAAGGRSIEMQMREMGHTVRIVPKVAIVDGINAARTIFPMCWFDAEKTADGLQALRRYCYDVNQDTGQYSRNPAHDVNSHAADAFRYMAVSLKEPRKAAPPKPQIIRAPVANGWMGV